MRWSPDIVGQWIARVPADHAWRTITRLMKWNEMDEMSVEKWWNVICGRGKWEKPLEKPTQIPFRPPRNPHGGTETRIRDPSGGRRASNRLRHEAALLIWKAAKYKKKIIGCFVNYNLWNIQKQFQLDNLKIVEPSAFWICWNVKKSGS